MDNRKKRFFDVLHSTASYNTLLTALLLALMLYYVKAIKDAGPTIFDDSYMYIRYANNFLQGHGVAWNPDGIQTYGTTSILYLAIITLARFFFHESQVGTLLTAVSAGIGLLALLALGYTCGRFAPLKLKAEPALFYATVFMAYFVISPVFLSQVSNGMDASLSFLCNVFLIFAVMNWTEEDPARKSALWLAVIAAYLAYLARPDNIFFVLLFPLLQILLLAPADKKQRLFDFFGSLFLVLAVDTLVKFAVFHDPLPLSFYAKSHGYYEGYAGASDWNPVDYLFEFGEFVLPFLVMIVLSLRKHTRALFAAFATPLVLTFGYYFFVVQIMGYDARYYFPATPYLVVSSFLLLDRGFKQLENGFEHDAARRIAARVVIILFMVSVLSRSNVQSGAVAAYERYLVSSTHPVSPSTQFTTPAASSLPQRPRWSVLVAIAEISEALPQGTKFAESEYGYAGAMAPDIQIIDLVGLNDPIFAHQGFSAPELFGREPDLIWFPHSDYTKIVAALIDSKQFWEQYDFYPGAFNFGIAIRKASPKYDEILGIIETSWKELYLTRKMKDYLATRLSN